MQTGLVNKTDFDNKLTSCNTRITSVTTTATTKIQNFKRN